MSQNQPDETPEQVEARIILQATTNPVLQHLTMGGGELIDHIQQAIFHNGGLDFGGGGPLFGIVYGNVSRSRTGLHFTLAIPEGRVTLKLHMRCQSSVIQRAGGITNHDRITVACYPYQNGFQVVYIENHNTNNLDSIRLGLLTWGTLNKPGKTG